MKKWLFLCLLAVAGSLPVVSTNLVVKLLSGADFRRELATIGKIVYRGDSLYLYDSFGTLLYKEQLAKVQRVVYSEGGEPTTGMAEASDADGHVRVFPNPTAETLVVEGLLAEDGQVRLYNQQGQLVKTGTADAVRTTLDVSDLPAGTYLLLCKGGAFKVIVQ